MILEQKTYKERLKNAKLHDRIMTPHEASLLIKDKMVVAVSGFTPSGYPKDVPIALAERVKKDNEQLKVTLYSGASLGPEVDQLWTEANIIERRLAYQTTDALRRAINDGSVNYLDMHLSHFPQYLNYGMIHMGNKRYNRGYGTTFCTGRGRENGDGSVPCKIS
jgi:succinyl-CoA:acetate CoA-transferase